MGGGHVGAQGAAASAKAIALLAEELAVALLAVEDLLALAELAGLKALLAVGTGN